MANLQVSWVTFEADMRAKCKSQGHKRIADKCTEVIKVTNGQA